MANPYKDAERKRREEAEKKQREAAQNPQDGLDPARVVPTPPEDKKPAEGKEEAATADLLADLDVEKSSSKTFSFYLTIKNVQKLERIAKKKGVSASKLLDHIISKL